MLNYLLEEDTEHDSFEDLGYIHKENLPNIDFIYDQVKGLVEAFKIGNMESLGSCLEEVCSELQITI